MISYFILVYCFRLRLYYELPKLWSIFLLSDIHSVRSRSCSSSCRSIPLLYSEVKLLCNIQFSISSQFSCTSSERWLVWIQLGIYHLSFWPDALFSTTKPQIPLWWLTIEPVDCYSFQETYEEDGDGCSVCVQHVHNILTTLSR